jgi:DNA-directed RNA polymerase specialized sigma24 family protein
MDRQILKETHLDLLEQLDHYYDHKLMQDSRARKNLEYYKDELMQNLAVEIHANCDRATYHDYKPAAFIWLKAEKVWIQFLRALNREKTRSSGKEIESLAEEYSTGDFLDQMELRNIISVIERKLTADKIKLIRLRLQGLSYEEIGRREGYSSTDAVKTTFHRLKKYILSLFNFQ